MAKRKKEIEVVDELELLLPPLGDEEAQTLEESLQRSGGPLNPIWLWKGKVVDGHNRYRACRKLGLPFETIDVWPDAKDLEEVKYLMKQAACGQRNLQADVKSRLRAQMVRYEVERNNRPADEAVKEVARTTGVSKRQVQRDCEKVKTLEGLTESCKNSEAVWKLSHNQIKQLGLLKHDEQHALIERAGYDAKKVKQELRRMAKVPDSTLEKATKEKAGTRKQERKSRETAKEKLDKAVGLLADFQKAAISARRALKVSDGKWSKTQFYIDKLDEMLATWKPEEPGEQ